MGRIFKTYQEAWEFVYGLVIVGYDINEYDHSTQEKAVAAFKMMKEAARVADDQDYRDINPLIHLD